MTLPGPATLPAARLLIHAQDNVGAGLSRLAGVLQRLRALGGRSASRAVKATLRLQIFDLRGREVVAVDDAGALVDVALPAGTYHVKALRGATGRSYTLVLSEGACFELHLRFGPERR